MVQNGIEGDIARMRFLNRLVEIPAERFKVAFLSWYAESEHQGWDGFSDPEVDSFDEILGDFVTYCENGGLEDPVGWFAFGKYMIDVSGNGDPEGGVDGTDNA